MWESSSKEIVEQAQRGDASAFEAIYIQHKKQVYSLCLRIVREPAEAEDMSQEVFVHLFRFLRTYRGDCKFSTWLHRVCVSVVYWKLRKKRIQTVSIDHPSDGDEISWGPRELLQNDHLLLGAVDRIGLERAVEELPNGYRLVFLLHDVYGYEHNEIAHVMGFSVGNSKSQLHKARLQIRAVLRRDNVSSVSRSFSRARREAPRIVATLTI